MNTHEINRILGEDIETKDIFIGTFPCDRLPEEEILQRPFAFVANTDVYSQPGTHWVAFYCGSTEMPIEIFDSLGGEQKNTFFLKFLGDKAVTYNTRRVQHLLSTRCGEHCIYFLKKRMTKTFTSIMNTYSYKNYMYNDRMVEIFCKENYGFKLSKKERNKFIEDQISRKLIKYFNENV